MVKKNKISDLAKDLNMTSKGLIKEIGEYFDEQLKASSVLTDEIANFVIEFFSQKNEVEDFKEYFESAAEPSKIKKDIESAEKAKLKSSKSPGNVTEIKTDLTSLQNSTVEFAMSEKNFKNSTKNGSNFENVNGFAGKVFSSTVEKKHNIKKLKPLKKKEKLTETIKLKPVEDVPSTNVVSDDESFGKRLLDTKTVSVNFEKYNERYEKMAGESSNVKDGFQKKQKFKKRSSQKSSFKKETEAQKLQRLALERARKQKLKVSIPDEIVVSELAFRLKVNSTELIKKLMAFGVMASINDVVDFDTAAVVAEELGAIVEHEVTVTIEDRLFVEEKIDSDKDLVKRSPVVVVMGHVDHGKTSLLDRIRNSNVSLLEAGGITQHIGAYTVKDENGFDITFLDTPGHEAFTSMRMRGANVTDIAVLVIAADDGIMPQTVEAINHAKAAKVSVIVAINKIDKPQANVDQIKQELTEHGLVIEEWGGDIICVPVSAKTGEGISQLLEMINLVAEVKDLKASVGSPAKGSVIEAYLDKGKGPVATLLVQNGSLKIGDFIIAGTSVGRVRAMVNDRGIEVLSAGPSTPVKITGLSEVPSAGDVFNVVKDEKLAKELVEKRKFVGKQEQFASYNKVTLDNLFSQIEDGERQELAIVVKADVQGSVEAVKSSFEKLSNDEVKVKVIHGAVGAINKSDVMLANASGAIVIGFNVRPDSIAANEAEENKIEVRLYRVIYEAIEDLKQAIKGMLKPKTRVVELGSAEVRQVYKISNVGTIAGCYVTSGKILKKAQVRLVRDGVVVIEDVVKSLKRFHDDVKEVLKEFECGVLFEKFNDIKIGDVIESFVIEEYRD